MEMGAEKKKEARILNQIFSDCIYFIFITVFLSMSIFHFEATDLLIFSTVSSHRWTEFSGYLSSYQCRDFNSVSQQVKLQGYACSHSKETMFCKS